MMRKLLFVFVVAGLAVASAKSYSIDLYQPALLGTTELAPGHYSVDVVGDKAIVRNGKIRGEAPVRVETMDRKYTSTAVRFAVPDGKMHIQEIHVGGTTTKIVFTE
jgi:hypothetical protein